MSTEVEILGIIVNGLFNVAAKAWIYRFCALVKLI